VRHRLEPVGESTRFQVNDEAIRAAQGEDVVRCRAAQVQDDPCLAVC
jgi:RNA:NAD 2'-phosphotransferase (TPT1/KptA family)